MQSFKQSFSAISTLNTSPERFGGAIDVHAASMVVARMMDGAKPKPCERIEAVA